MPHEMHHWQEIEYCKYVAEHTPLENMRLVEAVLKDGEDHTKPEENMGDVAECIKMARDVMEREKKNLNIDLDRT